MSSKLKALKGYRKLPHDCATERKQKKECMPSITAMNIINRKKKAKF